MYRGKGAGKLSGGTVVKCMAGAWDFRSECRWFSRRLQSQKTETLFHINVSISTHVRINGYVVHRLK